MFAVKLVISIKLRMFNEYTTYPLAKIGSCYGKLLSWIWQTKFLWLDNLSNNPSWKSGKHGNNIRHSQLIHLPNMSILTMLEAYSNNLHELATVYWGQKKSQIKSGKFESNFQQSYDNIFHLKLSATMLQLELLCIKSYPWFPSKLDEFKQYIKGFRDLSLESLQMIC